MERRRTLAPARKSQRERSREEPQGSNGLLLLVVFEAGRKQLPTTCWPLETNREETGNARIHAPRYLQLV